jgi:hypothetical protein
MDFFTMPALNFGVLYCFFVIAHDRRRMLHLNVTKYPTSADLPQENSTSENWSSLTAVQFSRSLSNVDNWA